MRPPFLILTLALGACATVPSHSRAPESQIRARVVESARHLLGRETLTLGGKPLPADCVSLPRAAYGANGIDLGAVSPSALLDKVRGEGHYFTRGSPRRGDLVFLRDAAHPRALHVGLVGAVDRDGTVVVWQRMAHGVAAYRMNPRHPHDERAPDSRSRDSRSWNDTLATRGDGAPAGALFSGYASLLP